MDLYISEGKRVTLLCKILFFLQNSCTDTPVGSEGFFPQRITRLQLRYLLIQSFSIISLLYKKKKKHLAQVLVIEKMSSIHKRNVLFRLRLSFAKNILASPWQLSNCGRSYSWQGFVLLRLSEKGEAEVIADLRTDLKVSINGELWI